MVGAPIGVPPLPAPARLTLRVFAGPQPADALRRFTARIGRQPRVDGAVGVRALVPARRQRRRAGRPAREPARRRRARVGGADLSPLPAVRRLRAPASPARTEPMHDLGVAVTTYFNPMICDEYQPVFDRAVATGALMRTANGDPYIYRYVTSRAFHVGQFDFTAGPGRDALPRSCCARRSPTATTAGWRTSASTRRSTATRDDGRDGTTMHNRYPSSTTTAPPTRWRAGSNGRSCASSARAGPARRAARRWCGAAIRPRSGDSTVWPAVVTSGLGMGLSGVSTWGSDIGGFFGFFGKQLTDEMLARWVQLGALSGVMRTQRDGIALPAVHAAAGRRRRSRSPTGGAGRSSAPSSIRIWSRPIPPTAAAGFPIMRHLVLAWPDDPQAVDRDDQYLFGPDLLVGAGAGPGRQPRATSICPPARGSISGAPCAYDEVSGGLRARRAPTSIAGAQTVNVPAPVDELPLLVRAGSGAAAAAARRRHARRLRRRRAGSRPSRRPARPARAHRLPARQRRARAPSARERYRSIEGDQRWELVLHGTRRAPGGCRRRWPPSSTRSSPARSSSTAAAAARRARGRSTPPPACCARPGRGRTAAWWCAAMLATAFPPNSARGGGRRLALAQARAANGPPGDAIAGALAARPCGRGRGAATGQPGALRRTAGDQRGAGTRCSPMRRGGPQPASRITRRSHPSGTAPAEPGATARQHAVAPPQSRSGARSTRARGSSRAAGPSEASACATSWRSAGSNCARRAAPRSRPSRCRQPSAARRRVASGRHATLGNGAAAPLP